MATRSTIAIEHADGTVEQIYSHWDGFLRINGKILNEHYNNAYSVKALIEKGDISSLAKTIRDTEFYCRDRGESKSETCAQRFDSFEDYCANHDYEEYEYIFRNDGKWYVSEYEGQYWPLSSALEEVYAKA